VLSQPAGEDFMASSTPSTVDDQKERSAGSDMGVYATFSPERKEGCHQSQIASYWRKYYRGAYQPM